MSDTSTIVTSCLCQPGSTGDIITGTSTCTLCNETTYKSTYGSDTCVSCPLWSISSIGSDDINDCECLLGFLGDPATTGSCIDIDECATNNGGCGTINICLNAPGTFTCLPIIDPSTIISLNGFTGSGSTGTLLADHVNGGQLFSTQLDSTGIDLDRVTSGSSIVDSLALVARGYLTLDNSLTHSSFNHGDEVITVNISISWGDCSSSFPSRVLAYYSSNITWITSTLWEITLPPGVGQNLCLSQVYCYSSPRMSQQICNYTTPSMPSSTTFSYPLPTLTGGTLTNGKTNTSVNAANTLGELVTMTGTNFLADTEHMLVYMGNSPAALYRYPCTLQTDMTSNTKIVCRTYNGGDGTGLVFTILAFNYNITGTDAYNYPAVPSIAWVEGCTTVNSSTTNALIASNCPTIGGSTITIHGDAFVAPLAAFINGDTCALIDFTLETITCQLAAGNTRFFNSPMHTSFPPS
jgi:hypothetical protein